MTNNIFKDRFSKKTNTELETIALNADVYTDEARLTALEVLKSRDYNSDTLEDAYQALRSQVIKQKATISESNNSSGPADESKELPALYSKRLILVFSVIFSTIFGGALLMSNFKQTGHSKARGLVLLFCIVYAFIPVILLSFFNWNSNFSIILNIIGGYILTEYFWNSYLGKDFKFEKKDWIKPSLIALGIALALLAFVFYFGGEAMLNTLNA